MSYQFTTIDIGNHVEIWFEIEDDPIYQADMLEKRKMLNQVELNFVNKTETCPQKEVQDIQYKLGGLDPFTMKTILENKFMDYNVMRDIMCVIRSITISTNTPIKNIDRIKNWFTDLNLIQTPSVEGYAIKTGLDRLRDVFIIKTARKKDVNLLHELTIGLYLNSLRSIIPNFMFTFGGFECSPAFITDSKIDAWCNNQSNLVGYLILEKIHPSISFYEYSKTCSFEQLLDKFFQVLNALNIANKLQKFTHNDLHAGNILIRKLPQISYIPYSSEVDEDILKLSEIEYIETDGISTIIDYGRSRVVNPSGFPLGIYKYRHIGVNTEEENIVTDVYKLLINLLTVMRSYNPTVYKQAKSLVLFFNNSEDIDNILEKTDYGHFAPDITIGLSLKPYIEWVRSNFNLSFIVPFNIPSTENILSCNYNICKTNVYQETKIEEITANTVFELYDIYTSLIFNKEFEKADQLIRSVNSQHILTTGMNEYNNLLISLKKKLPIRLKSIINLEPIELFTEEVLDEYKEYLTKVSQIFELFQKLLKLKKFMTDIAKIYNRIDIIKKLNEESYVELTNILNTIFESIKDDVFYLNNIRPNVENLITSEYEWWWTKPVELLKIRSEI